MGAAADALGATFATYTVVVDSAGRVRYRGGIDSDKQWLSDGATLWLRDALDRLLAGGDPDPRRDRASLRVLAPAEVRTCATTLWIGGLVTLIAAACSPPDGAL